MLVSFSVSNFLSFGEEQKLSLEPEPLKEFPDFLHIPYLYDPDIRLLKSIAVYGHNSHGKSNFFKAYETFRETILRSFNLSTDVSDLDIDYFKLDVKYEQLPSKFEAVFLIKDTKYRYGFEILKGRVKSEYLWYAEKKNRSNYLFERNELDFTISKAWQKSSEAITQGLLFTKSHNLFLSVLLAQANVPRVKEIGSWLRGNIIIKDVIDDDVVKRAVLILSQESYRPIIQKFIQAADIGFTTIIEKLDSLTSNKLKFSDDFIKVLYSHEIKEFELYTKHNIYNERKLVDEVYFTCLKSESTGSIKYLVLSCFITFAIKHGQLLWIDELDSKLHVFLIHSLFKTFNDKRNNSNGAQLVFTIHNTSLLSPKLLRRDQLYFVEKDAYGQSSILKMYNNESRIRKEIDFEKSYLRGKLKGVSKEISQDNNKLDLFNL